MVKFNRYEEFNSGKITLSVPTLEDEKKLFGEDTIEVDLIITAKQAQKLKSIVEAYSTLTEIMDISYPNMKKSNDAFVIRHAEDLLEQFMLWSGVPQEKLDNVKKAQEQMVKDFINATPEERMEFMKKDKKDDNNS